MTKTPCTSAQPESRVKCGIGHSLNLMRSTGRFGLCLALMAAVGFAKPEYSVWRAENGMEITMSQDEIIYTEIGGKWVELRQTAKLFGLTFMLTKEKAAL